MSDTMTDEQVQAALGAGGGEDERYSDDPRRAMTALLIWTVLLVTPFPTPWCPDAVPDADVYCPTPEPPAQEE